MLGVALVHACQNNISDLKYIWADYVISLFPQNRFKIIVSWCDDTMVKVRF